MLATEQPWQRFKQVILVHSVYDRSERIYLEELQDIQRQHPDRFRYFFTLTRDQADGHFRERIPKLLESGALERAAETVIDVTNSHIMLCGNPGMVHSTLALLESRGLRKHQRFAPGQISLEIY
jgi:ferredoxin--NADP+ reductase